MKITRFLMAGATALFAAGQANAITWGQSDNDGHPNVVQLLFEQGEGNFFTCTGTLLTPTVVLTAGHCMESGGEINLNTWVKNNDAAGGPFSIGGELNLGACDPATFTQCVRDSANANPFWTRATAHPHPEYDDYSAFPDTFDVGVAVLEDPIFVAEYGALPAKGELNRIAKKKGPNSQRLVRVVGYGSQGTIPAFADPPGSERIVGTATMQNINNSLVGDHSIQLSNNPGQGNGVGGTCFGDSGGPAFIIDPDTGEETNVVGSVTSFGISGQCAGRDFNFRMDIDEGLDFVNSFLP